MFFPDRKVEIVVDTPVLAVVDGKFGFGQTVGAQAVQIGIDKCKAMGLAAVALRNAGHLGRIGDWAEMAAKEGLVSLHFVNVVGSVLVAPFGGVERRFSTAPICIGIPRAGRTRCCSTLRPRWSPRARFWWRARAASRCPPMR